MQDRKYSYLEKCLHRLIFNSDTIQSILYDLEKSFFLKKKQNDKHMFIVGLPRSGTTAFLNLFYNSGQFASLIYKDMPFILAPNLWNKIIKKTKNTKDFERVHQDGVKFNTESPEAFEEVFWKNILKKSYISKKFLKLHDISNEEIENFNNFINLILNVRGLDIYISKNNSNLLRLVSLSKLLKNSCFVVMFRNPINHAFSLLNQHKKFIQIQRKDIFVKEYMNFLGHYEFGENLKRINFDKNNKYNDATNLEYWLEIWHDVYEFLITNVNKKNVKFICYEDLCEKPKIYLEKRIQEKKFLYNLNYNQLINKNKKIDFKASNLIIKTKELYDKMRIID